MPITQAGAPVATLGAGVQTAVSNAAVKIANANTAARIMLVQNVGSDAMRIGPAGVTATTGFRIAAGVGIVFDAPPVSGGDLYAIRETTDTTALVQFGT